MISQHRPNKSTTNVPCVIKQLKTKAVANKMKTVYSNSPPSHGLSVDDTTTQRVAGNR